MFDTISQGGVSDSVTFNSVAGTLVKSCTNSKFIRFHMTSELAKAYFDTISPNNGLDYAHNKSISILQVMLCGDKEFLIEYLELD